MAYDDKATFFYGTEAITDSAVISSAVYVGETLADTGLSIDARVSVAFHAGTSGILSLITSASSNLGTPTTLFSTASIDTATLIKGYKFKLPNIPKGCLGYVGLVFTPTGTFDAGKIKAFISEDVTSATFGPTSPPSGSRL